MRFFATGALLLLLMGSLSGCWRDSGPPIVPVSGTVTLDGKPLGGVTVNFWSGQDAFGGYAGQDGRYQLRPGATPGSHKVTIAPDLGEPDPLAREMARQHSGAKPDAPRRPPPAIPARYSHPQQTVLTFVVEYPGTDQADFKLTTK